MLAQPTLPNLTLHWRTRLVTVDTVRVVLGVDTDTVLCRVEAGEIRWAWDIGLSSSKRELRIWAREIAVGGERFTPEEVVDMVIHTQREHLRSSELAQILICSRPHMLELMRQGELEGPRCGHAQHITRTSFAAFLRRRLVGAYDL